MIGIAAAPETTVIGAVLIFVITALCSRFYTFPVVVGCRGHRRWRLAVLHAASTSEQKAG